MGKRRQEERGGLLDTGVGYWVGVGGDWGG